MLAPPETFLEQAGETPSWSCGTTGAPLDFRLREAQSGASGGSGGLPNSITGAAITSLHTAIVAVDTDNELLFNKFGDNTSTATNYIASLIAQMNVMYQRDLLIQLVQGTTFLRVGNSSDGNHFNDDPWNQPSTGSADGNQLNEVSNYWSTTNNGIARANVVMLSGKGSSNGASGIAWVPPTALCSHFYGTSFTQVFLAGTTPGFGDVLVVGHEIGHNFGSPHTHCYSPPIDTCYNGEAPLGCWAGAQSCPAPATINGVTNVTGTLMSYCHLLGGCSSSLVFHPRTVSLLQPLIQNAVGSCIFPALQLSSVSPATGFTTGGASVTIYGGGFVSGATVSFGGAAATSVVVANSSTITAVTPAHASGPTSVTVTLPDASNTTKTNAYFYAPPPAPTDFYTLTPCRVLDTRNANGPLGGPALAPSAQRTFTVTGTCGIPSGADAIAANVTVVSPTASGYLASFPGDAFDLGSSLLNFSAGVVRADNAVLTLATNGTGSILVVNASGGTTNVIVDVVGYFN
jgi:metallopeptidase family M12-like protein/IPT/TIG domain-containing protein